MEVVVVISFKLQEYTQTDTAQVKLNTKMHLQNLFSLSLTHTDTHSTVQSTCIHASPKCRCGDILTSDQRI